MLQSGELQSRANKVKARRYTPFLRYDGVAWTHHSHERCVMYSTILPFAFTLPANSLVFDVGALYRQMQSLTDQRDRRGRRYSLALILTIAVLAKLAGYNRVQDIAEWASWRTKELCDLFAFPRSTLPHPTSWSRILGNAVQPDAL